MTDLKCYHCGLPVLEPDEYVLEIDGQTRQMCCPGCQAVASTILAGGLDNYYQYRTDLAEQAEHETQDLSLFDQADFQTSFVQKNPQNHEAQLLIGGITCAACIWLLEQYLGKQPGIQQVNINLSLHKALIQYDPEIIKLSQIAEHIQLIGYQASPYQTDQQLLQQQQENKQAIRRLGVAAFGMMQVAMYAFALHAGAIEGIEDHYRLLLRWVSLLVSTPVVFYAAKPFFVAAWRSIISRQATMDLPVAIAIGIAYISSIWATYSNQGDVYYDSVVMFTFFLLSGRYLEMRARHSFNRSNQALQKLLPVSCQKVMSDQSQVTIALSDVQVGDILSVKPGEIIPADGTLYQGHTQIDESAFTGEYLPINKQAGDSLAAGTINVDSPIHVQVSHVGRDSQLHAIIQLLDRAQQYKPAVALLADKISAYFVTIVLSLSALVAMIWWQIDSSKAFWITLSVLVASCPCALSLATPTALTVALTSLREKGLLISRAHVLSSLPDITRVVFDKTGTLTYGQLRLHKVYPLQTRFNTQVLINLAATLEADSEHPVAKAFQQQQTEKYKAENVTAYLGKGMSATLSPRDTNSDIFNSQIFYIGSLEFIQQQLSTQIPPQKTGQKQTVYLANQNQLLACFELDDEIRPSAKLLVQQLQGQGMQVEMLTGDASGAGQLCAEQLGIKHYQQGMSPEQKLARVERLQANGEKVLMVGDGINDVPILAAAEVSIAVANASDLAKANADCVLLSSQLQFIHSAQIKAKRCQRNIKQNITWSILYNGSIVPLAALGFIPPYLAAIGMSASSLIVVLNALRLKS